MATVIEVNGINIHYKLEGPENGPTIVFSNSLGTDMRIWDGVILCLPKNLKILRYDKRGHGLSDCPNSPYSMGTLVKDVEALMDALKLKNSLFIGLSIGGMIAQGLALKRLDLVRAMVLSNTAARIGNRQIWEDRISKVRSSGMKALTEETMKRWFSNRFLKSKDLNIWKNMFERQPIEGYIGCSNAISGTDFYTPTSSLRLPTIGIAGSEDGSTPPDLVRETCDLIPGSQFNLIKGVGHIPCVEAPEKYAKILSDFMKETGHAL